MPDHNAASPTHPANRIVKAEPMSHPAAGLDGFEHRFATVDYQACMDRYR